MIDFTALENELNTKGTKIVYDVKHNQQTLTFLYEDILETKQQMDSIVNSYLTNFTLASILENKVYKGDATINQLIP